MKANLRTRNNHRKYNKPFYYYLWRDKWLYLMLAPVILYYFIFKYLPIGGLAMAFQNYNIFEGISKSKWVGLDVFKGILIQNQFWKSVRNTLVLNLSTLAVSFPFTIILSLMLNELGGKRFKRISQSLLYLPHFISWVVVAGIAANMFRISNGTINNILVGFGIDPIPFLSSKSWWVFTYVITHVWKEIGWGTIVYLAALTGVDESLYEAAYIDGATKFQRIIHITLPSVRSVIVVMLILQISKMLAIGLDAPLLLGNTKVMEISEVLSTYVYRLGLLKAQYSQATAVGLFQSAVNIIILFLADRFAKLIGEDGIL